MSLVRRFFSLPFLPGFLSPLQKFPCFSSSSSDFLHFLNGVQLTTVSLLLPQEGKGGKQRREISAAPDFMAPIFSPFPLYARSFGERKCGKLGFCSHSAYTTVKEGEIMEAGFSLAEQVRENTLQDGDQILISDSSS